jgi:ribosomal protein L34E
VSSQTPGHARSHQWGKREAKDMCGSSFYILQGMERETKTNKEEKKQKKVMETTNTILRISFVKRACDSNHTL